ncbi:MAG: cytochrome c5 family protein [Calditrichaeota bacterium]|nr:MAG: cytochrome c5 family protein [Calditrichota bacterium]
MKTRFIVLAVFSFILLSAGTPGKETLKNGEKVFNKICFACHKDGVAGAAAITNKKRWQENADKGLENLMTNIKKGIVNGKYGTMPPRGGCTDCTDEDLKDAILYMIHESGARLK